MPDIRYTKKRHELLREVASGDLKVYIGLQRDLFRGDFEFLQGAERRTARELQMYITHVPSLTFGLGGTCWAVLTRAGWELLDEWNGKY